MPSVPTHECIRKRYELQSKQIENVAAHVGLEAAMPLVARGNPDDTTAIVAVVVEACPLHVVGDAVS